jgi:matrixin
MMGDMPVSTKSRCALLALLVTFFLTVGTLAPATASSASRASVHSVGAAAHSSARVASDAGERKARKHKKKARKHQRASYLWQGSRIYYYEALPSKWHWSVSHAVAQWNRVGGGIKFVRTTHRSKAQLTIGYGNIAPSAGYSSVGRVKNARVRLNSAYGAVDAHDAHYRIEVMAVLTHELGHVLGFEHTHRKCALMSPMMDIEGCGVVSAARPGYYKCNSVDSRLKSSFVRSYGGRVRGAGSTWCLIDPLPSVLTGVAFDDTAGSGVSISWARPSYAPAGSRVVIRHWTADSCDIVPGTAATDYAEAAAGSWVAPDTSASADNCYQVQLVNRYGVSKSPAGARFARTVAAEGTEASGPGDAPLGNS